MPVPVSIVASGGVPIVSSALGTPMTPVTAPVYAVPVTIVTTGGFPVHLVNEDFTDWVP